MKKQGKFDDEKSTIKTIHSDFLNLSCCRFLNNCGNVIYLFILRLLFDITHQ